MQNNIRSHLIRLNILCNEKCKFCNVTQETEPKFREKNILEILHEVKKVIKLSSSVENVKISLSWWEPTLRKDLDKIVLGIKKMWVNYIELQTNATLLSPDLTQRLVKYGVNKFFISFHSHKKNIFEDYVWLTWIYDIVVENIKNLWRYKDIEVLLNPVISTKNYEDLEWFFDFVKNEFPFIKYISLSFIQPHWKARDNIDLMLDYDTINKKLWSILDYAFGLWFIVNNPYCGLPICVMQWHKYIENCTEASEWKELANIWRNRNDNNKTYIEECEKCVYKWLCGWIWNEYIERFNNKWIISIEK